MATKPFHPSIHPSISALSFLLSLSLSTFFLRILYALYTIRYWKKEKRKMINDKKFLLVRFSKAEHGSLSIRALSRNAKAQRPVTHCVNRASIGNDRPTDRLDRGRLSRFFQQTGRHDYFWPPRSFHFCPTPPPVNLSAGEIRFGTRSVLLLPYLVYRFARNGYTLLYSTFGSTGTSLYRAKLAFPFFSLNFIAFIATRIALSCISNTK